MDNLITDLLAKRNFSQARKAIEKKLKQKKYDGDHGLLVRLLVRYLTIEARAHVFPRSQKPEHYSVLQNTRHA